MYDLSCPSLGNSTISCDDQASLPNGGLSLKMGVPFQQSFSFKQRGARFPDQESSSIQSTGQSYPELPTIGSNIQPPQKDGKINDGKVVDGQVESSVSMISQDSIFTPSQMDYKQSLVCVSLPNAEPYLGGFMATYCPHTMIPHNTTTQMMGLATSRVPLPFDPFRDEPMYVNPKQYHGILRRRQQRAKLEALNKLTKDRKPYLHESRHLHAVRRARGSGGRFVSAKKLHESKPGSAINGISRSEAHNSGKYRDGSCTTSSSDVTTASNGEIMFPNPNFRFSNYSPYVGGEHKWSLQ